MERTLSSIQYKLELGEREEEWRKTFLTKAFKGNLTLYTLKKKAQDSEGWSDPNQTKVNVSAYRTLVVRYLCI